MAPKAAPLNDPRRKVLFLSLHKDDWLDEVYSQLYRALARNAYLSEVCDPVDAAAALVSASLPNVVVVSDAALADKDHSAILEKLVEYTNNGGTLIFAMSFSSFFPMGRAREFFQRWGLSWDAGDYHRTTVGLNPAGVPHPLSVTALFPSFSMKALHLKNVSPECSVYYPTPESRIESHVFPPDKIRPEQATQTPAAFAPVGRGFLGYIGDVNGEQGSTRLIIEMCGVRIRPGDMGSRKFMNSVSFGPSGKVESTTQTEEEVPLPVKTSPRASTNLPSRPREPEVRARVAACEKKRKDNTEKAEKLKEEVSSQECSPGSALIMSHFQGNELFRQEKWAKAADKYREAAVLAGPQPVYVSNLAAALLKLEEYAPIPLLGCYLRLIQACRWDAAESAATRALLHDPHHIKSLFRRALARKARQKFMGAESGEQYDVPVERSLMSSP